MYAVLGILLLRGSLYVNRDIPYDPSANGQAVIHIEDILDRSTPNPFESPANTPMENIPTPTAIPLNNEDSLSVRGAVISLGDKKDRVIAQLGNPGRIVDTEYDFNYYIYNNNYKKLVFIALKDNQVVGFYTDSLDFNFKGIFSGSDIDTVVNALGKEYTMEETLTYETDFYHLTVLMDCIGTQKVIGIFVLANSVKLGEYTDSVLRNIELLVYDLTNSVRARNGVPILSWSSSAAIASRKHSNDMAVNRFFDHINPSGQKPGDRIRAEGIYYRNIGENIIAGYGTSILSNHAWFNSAEHRSIMLNETYRYLGVGFTYQPSSIYHTYITQDYYR